MEDRISCSSLASSLLPWFSLVVGYFFIEFEDIEEEGFAEHEETQEKEDPYAWGRKEAAQIPEQQPATVPIQSAQPQSSAQHPGWLWDQETNQWVPDPNYQPPSQ